MYPVLIKKTTAMLQIWAVDWHRFAVPLNKETARPKAA